MHPSKKKMRILVQVQSITKHFTTFTIQSRRQLTHHKTISVGGCPQTHSKSRTIYDRSLSAQEILLALSIIRHNFGLQSAIGEPFK